MAARLRSISDTGRGDQMDNEQIERCRRKAISMLEAYQYNKGQIEMLQSMIKEASGRTDVGNMAVSYDQPNGGQTNKVSSVVESSVVTKEQELEQLHNKLLYYQGQVERIDIAMNNMPIHQRNLLRLKYIERRPWKQLVQEIPYSEDYIRKEIKESAINMLTGYLFPELSRVNLFEVI